MARNNDKTSEESVDRVPESGGDPDALSSRFLLTSNYVSRESLERVPPPRLRQV